MTSIDLPGRVEPGERVSQVEVQLLAVPRFAAVARARDVAAAYVGLTKPRIIELLLVTTVPAMFLAAGVCRRCGWCC